MTLERRFFLAAFALAGVAVVGIAGYLLIEHWSLLEAAYTKAITLTSVGFMEVRPLSPASRALREVEAVREANGLVLAWRRGDLGDDEYNPSPDSVLSTGDTLLLTVEVPRLEKLRERLVS